jgi:hypothetical protein
MYSKATEAALKAYKTYVNDDVWHCYWHGLSGDELKTQIFTAAHKPSDQIISFSFPDLVYPYKLNEEQGVAAELRKKFGLNADEIAQYALQFLNDARIEYLGKPLIKELA